MTFDDRLRRELQKAIPSDPPPDPAALADELIRRASGDGIGGGPGSSGGGWRFVLWLAVLAILGGLIGGALGISGIFDSEPATTVTTIAVTTTTTTTATSAPTVITTAPTVTTAAPVETATTAPVTATTAQGTTAPLTPAPDTTPPEVGQLSVAPDLIWELDSEVISCGAEPRQATISAQASDDRGVAAVTLSWAFPGGPNGSKAMSGSGTYSATFGPFPYLTVTDNSFESVTLTITASDAAGNSAATVGSITVRSTSTCFG